jgi:8-amino-7-oxononanoate synthase
MLAFDSALYLGMRHPAACADWDTLTAGQPAAYAEDPASGPLCRKLAALAGAADCALAPSTLHLFWDLFPLLVQGRPARVLIDAAAYPVARWCAGRIGAPCIAFRPGDMDGLQRLAARTRAEGRLPLLLADGYSPGTEHAPPLADYAGCMARHGGWLIVDDTQAFGLLGQSGGGSLRGHGIGRLANVACGTSLAKAFGVPLAALFGSAALLERFRAEASTRVHCSPPSSAALAAARRALALNALVGEALRSRLCAAVEAMRDCAGHLGLELQGGSFPVQLLVPPAGVPAEWLHRALAARGVHCLALRRANELVLGFLLTAEHSPAQARAAIRMAAMLVDHYRRQYEHAMRMCSLQL